MADVADGILLNVIWAEQALTTRGWQSDVRITIDGLGHIESVIPNAKPCGHQVKIAVPAPASLHSHGFQRALSGMTEVRSRSGSDTFWTWRKLMFEFISRIQPRDIEAITAYAQMEMLESGFASVAEFHYIHHDIDGSPYSEISELCSRIISAATQSGIGLTLLPVFYQYGGCGKQELLPQQFRFANSLDSYLNLLDEAKTAIQFLPSDCRIGIAAHSMRAVDPADIVELSYIRHNFPFHLHVAEQAQEVVEIEHYLGARPVEWLVQNAELDENWCLIHATHMTDSEARNLAATGAVVGLCPITEANLGDGIFNGVEYVKGNGKYGVGTDSNIRISLCEELRMLEYSQRLKHRERSVLAPPGTSSGRTLFESSLLGGNSALARNSGTFKPGIVADVLVLDGESPVLADCHGDAILDSFIFAGDNRLVKEVWSAGRQVVKEGRHINRDQIQENFQLAKKRLRI